MQRGIVYSRAWNSLPSMRYEGKQIIRNARTPKQTSTRTHSIGISSACYSEHNPLLFNDFTQRCQDIWELKISLGLSKEWNLIVCPFATSSDVHIWNLGHLTSDTMWILLVPAQNHPVLHILLRWKKTQTLCCDCWLLLKPQLKLPSPNVRTSHTGFWVKGTDWVE